MYLKEGCFRLLLLLAAVELLLFFLSTEAEPPPELSDSDDRLAERDIVMSEVVYV